MAKSKKKGNDQALRPGIIYGGVALIVALLAFALVNFVILGDGGGEETAQTTTGANVAPVPPAAPQRAPEQKSAKEIGLFEGRNPFRSISGNASAPQTLEEVLASSSAATPAPAPAATAAPAAKPTTTTTKASCPASTQDLINQKYASAVTDTNSTYNQKAAQINETRSGSSREQALQENEEQREAALTSLKTARQAALDSCDPSKIG